MPVVNFHAYKQITALDDAFGPGGWLYVGRRNQTYGLEASPLANPFTNNPRAHARVVADPMEAYRQWLWARMKDGDQRVLRELERIDPETALVCWCDPRPCHGHVIEGAAAWWREHRYDVLPPRAM